MFEKILDPVVAGDVIEGNSTAITPFSIDALFPDDLAYYRYRY